MAAWKMKEANDTWEDVCERAYSGEPQYLTRNGVSYRIVISLARHDADTQRSVFDTLTSCPCDLSELVAEDRRDEVSSFEWGKLIGESIRLGKTLWNPRRPGDF